MEQQGVLFDLDMTLVDTSRLAVLRKQRLWKQVYSHISETAIYPGIKEFILELSGIYKVGVVTTSPRPYAERVVQYHTLPISIVAAYHDTSNHKPHPAPLLYACQSLGLSPSMSFSIGDEFSDYKASNAAGMEYLHAAWGSNSLSGIPSELLCRTVAALRERLL